MSVTIRTVNIADVLYRVEVIETDKGRMCKVILDPHFDDDNYGDDGKFLPVSEIQPPVVSFECADCADDPSRECTRSLGCERK